MDLSRGPLKDGTTKEAVAQMTRYQKIELIERIHGNPEMGFCGMDLSADISRFIEALGNRKRGFMTCVDMELENQKRGQG